MDKASGTVLDFFTTVEDPRQRGKVLYRLDEILLIALAGCLAGADNMVEMAGWARLNLESLRSIRPFARGVPSHDTLNDVVNALDPGTFEECFEAWIEAIRPAPRCTPCRPTRASSALYWPRRSWTASRTRAP
jgi:DDE family transposase